MLCAAACQLASITLIAPTEKIKEMEKHKTLVTEVEVVEVRWRLEKPKSRGGAVPDVRFLF